MSQPVAAPSPDWIQFEVGDVCPRFCHELVKKEIRMSPFGIMLTWEPTGRETVRVLQEATWDMELIMKGKR